MENFKAYTIDFLCEAVTDLYLPRFNGSTLRGAFFGALRQDFCLNNKLDTCLHCPAAEHCPICRLVATVEWDNSRGAEIPRPYTIQPVIAGHTHFPRGESFAFGITLFGESLSLFPHTILAVQKMGETGMGIPIPQTRERGRFLLRQAKATNPVVAMEKPIYLDDTRIVNVPDIPITHRDILDYTARLDTDRLCLNLLTPLRLVMESALVPKLTFRIFMQRLLRRLTDLYHYCGDQDLEMDFPALLKQAEEVQVSQDNTRWLDLSSYSGRRQASTPIGGLMGEITFAGNLKEFLPLLVWGQITHVGKDATKGNGWYRIAVSSS